MADDKKKTGAVDRTRINVHQKHELKYWCEKLGVSKGLLRRAVAEAGVMVKDVKAWLKDPVPERKIDVEGLIEPNPTELEVFVARFKHALAQGPCDIDDMTEAFKLGLTLGKSTITV